MREMAAVYGSPEILGEYKLETLRLRCQLDTINAKLGENIDLQRSARRVELQERLNVVRAELQRREGACVYGSPEIIEEYGRETRRLRGEAEELQKAIRDLDNPNAKVNDGKVEALYGVPMPEEEK